MRKKHNRLPAIIIGMTLVSALGGGAFALIRFVGSAAPPPKQVVQEIHIIRPPPPPDVPPPPPPPPEKEDIPQPQQQPDPTPSNDPPPAANLGLDTEGGAGGDAFGLVGNKGGRDITAVGGSAFAWYASLLRDQIRDVLNGDQHIRSGAYRVSLRVWVSEDGTVRRVEILHSSGNAERDHAIEADLEQIKRMPQAPPAGMPDAISLEVRAQG
jgi:protein TonB